MRGTDFLTQFAKLTILLIVKLNSRQIFSSSHLLSNHRCLRIYELPSTTYGALQILLA